MFFLNWATLHDEYVYFWYVKHVLLLILLYLNFKIQDIYCQIRKQKDDFFFILFISCFPYCRLLFFHISCLCFYHPPLKPVQINLVKQQLDACWNFCPTGQPSTLERSTCSSISFITSVWTPVYLPLLLSRNKADKSLALLSAHVWGL